MKKPRTGGSGAVFGSFGGNNDGEGKTHQGRLSGHARAIYVGGANSRKLASADRELGPGVNAPRRAGRRTHPGSLCPDARA
jgi:hypothetical protein